MTESSLPSGPSDFENKFDPLQYNLRYFGTPPPKNKLRTFYIDRIHEFFTKVLSDCQHDLRVLDYGCGPVIAWSIRAAGNERVSEIVFAEYAQLNRDALKKWIRKEDGFDWSPYFKYIVRDLEGKSEDAVVSQEKRMRSISKVVSCDITSEQPIESGYEGPYDVVITVQAIENVCKSDEEYFKLLSNLSKLVKPGGYLLMVLEVSSQNSSHPTYYEVGDETFYYYAVSRDVLFKALKKASFGDVISFPITKADVAADPSESELPYITDSEDDFVCMFLQAKKL